jgi:hypothetical protein
MSLRTLMQAGPVKANELFVRLSDTSDGAVKTREKLFAELKAELELHIGLEEQHLFPVLRRNAETKEIVTEAIKDNKALRANLAELEALPKNDDAFPERLRALQKIFRQHARDEKVQGIAQKIEAGVAEAELNKHEELEARREKARQDRQEAEREAARQAEVEHAQKAAAEQARHDEAEQKRAKAQQERELSERATRVAMTAQTNVSQIAETAVAGTERVGETIRDTAQIMMPDFRAVATLPSATIGAMAEIRSAWMEWMGQTTRAGTQMSQKLLWQAAEQQQRLVSSAMQGWMEQNARVMRITLAMTQTTARSFVDRATTRSRRDR